MNQTELMQRCKKCSSELYQEQVDQKVKYEVVSELDGISPLSTDRQNYILMAEVEAAVKILQNNKAPGRDSVTSEMIMVKQLHELCNKVWKESKVPDGWKKSLLARIHNKEAPRNARTTEL